MIKHMLLALLLVGCADSSSTSQKVWTKKIDICEYRFYFDPDKRVCFADSRESKYLHTMIDCSVMEKCLAETK